MFSDVVVKLFEFDNDCGIVLNTRRIHVEFEPPEGFLNVDLGIKGQNGSRFLEPRIHSLFFSICLQVMQRGLHVVKRSVYHLVEQTMNRFHVLQSVLLLQKDRSTNLLI